MSNCWVDLGYATMFLVCGANPAENHPASINHLNKARFDGGGRGNNAALIVVDPRQTRTARMIKAGYNASNPNDMRNHDRYVRIRPGTNIAFINGVLNAIMDRMHTAAANPSDPDHAKANNFFEWHNSSAAHARSLGRMFTSDAGTIQHALNAGELATADYSFDGGLTWVPASIRSGYPKYCDSRVKVNVATGDYQRAILRTSTGVTFSNFLVFADDVFDPDCVFQRLKAHVAKYDATTVSGICGCTTADIAAVADAFIKNSRFASGDYGAALCDKDAAAYRATNIMYAMGATQFTSGSQGVRSYAILQGIMGNMGRPGGGINALRGIHNVQGSTDMGVLFDLIPGYSGNPGPNISWSSYVNGLFGNRVLSRAAFATVDCANPHADLVYTAKTAGTGGNAITITYSDPGAASQPISVGVAGTAITVSLATDGAGAIISTATQVKAAVDGNVAATALVAVANATGNDGTGVVQAIGPVVLKNGTTTTRNAYVETELSWQQRGFFNMTREWFGSQALTSSADIDKMYACWPKGNGTQHTQAYRNMADGSIRAAVVWGMNPAISEPNQTLVRTALENLELLVVADLFATETAQCKRKAGSVTYLLPAASYVETAGHAASSGRWLQWRSQARTPKGNSKSDIELLLRLAKALDGAGAFSHIQGQWAGTALAGANVFTTLYGKYGWDGTGSMEAVTGVDFEGNTLVGSEYVAEQIFKEMCSPLDGYAAAGAAGFVGGHKGTIWIYSGVNATQGGAYNPDQLGNVHPPIFEDGLESGTGIHWGIANRAKVRKGAEKDRGKSGQYHRYGWAWLLNRRVLYNNSEVAGDVADVFVAPGFMTRLWTIDGTNTLADWSWVFRTYNQLADMPDRSGGKHVHPGRFPAYTEPYETPFKALAETWGYNTRIEGGSPVVLGKFGVGETPRIDVRTAAGEALAAQYPLILTTFRSVEHFQGGPITRNNEWNVELEPEPWIEINSVDALKYGIKDGEYVNVQTVRGDSTVGQEGRTVSGRAGDVTGWAKGFKARVGAGTLANQRVAPGTVAIPWHWGDRGLGKGSRANDMCIDAWDANTFIPEYKVCLCKIEKANP